MLSVSMQALDPSRGGSPDSSLDEVIAKLARAKAGKGYGSAREALLLNGRFVLQQLAAEQARQQPGADGGNKGKGAAGLEGGAFAKSLEDEVWCGRGCMTAITQCLQPIPMLLFK